MKNNKLKITGLAIAVIAITAFGLVSFTHLNKENKNITNKYEKLNNNYNELLREKNKLSKNKEVLDKEIDKKNNEIDVYISKIKKNKLTTEQLEITKTKVNKLIKELDCLITEKKKLDFHYAKVYYAGLDLKKENTELKKNISDLKDENARVKNKAKLAKRLYILSVKIESFNKKNNDKLVASNKARKVNFINTCISMDALSLNSKNQVFFQILTPNFEVLNAKDGFDKNGKKILYTKKVNLSNFNALEDFCFETEIQKEEGKLQKGQYILNIFDEDSLISREFFTLK
ncbi:hypothetical protein [Pseudofulvibacter geojedonensis]|uniref:Chromosome segregation protein SMC n=1 Tax=Pseudofulvibacter geojedonensis TaxID=1123758 RepID=A0ABW3I0G7_9FLAO